MFNQRICGQIDSNDESLLEEISLSALMSRISPLSTLQYHLPPLYLESSALSYLEITTSTWGLRMSALHGRMICSPCLGCQALVLIAADFQQVSVCRAIWASTVCQVLCQPSTSPCIFQVISGQTPYNTFKLVVKRKVQEELVVLYSLPNSLLLMNDQNHTILIIIHKPTNTHTHTHTYIYIYKAILGKLMGLFRLKI